MNKAMAAAWRAMAKIDGLFEGPSTFADDDLPRAFWVNGKQVVNLRDPDRIEVRVTKPVIRAERERLKADPRVELRPNASDWLMVHVARPADAALVVELAQLAANAHAGLPAPAGSPVPEGADLARRRRFH